ncbi:ABC transporter substrate-binding protein [Oceanobacillus sp. M65]|uniref:ABC transporter substrate-binding protein n=1 Tax=Oceanobacillus sp. M65 TaxID=3457435 RepID=UPI003FCCA3E1
MKLLEHYEVINRSLNETEEEVSITVNEIANLLSCSHRNAKIIIQNLQEQKWIKWKSGIGRGNYSTLKLLKNFELLVVERAKETITPHSIDQAITLLNKYQVKDSLQREFIDWIFHSYLSEYKDQSSNMHSRLHFPSYRPLPILDPAFVCRRSENHVMRHVFSQLVQFNQDTGDFLPHLAHFWEHNHDSTKWIFYLQKGVRFHHGKKMTSDDVCYSFWRHKQPISAYGWMVQDLHKVSAIQPYIVEFQFKKPCPFFLHMAASLGGSILPNDKSSRKKFPLGTGPYKISENTDEKLTLHVFNDYFLRRPFLEEIKIYFFPKLYDNATVIDSVPNSYEMNFYHYPYKGRELHDLEKYTALDRGSKLLTFNRKKGLLANDPLLRKAIVHLLSPEKMIRELGGTRHKKASHLLEQFEHGDLTRSKRKGRQALAKSDYKGEPLVLASYTGAGNEADGEWIKEELLKEGINVSLTFHTYEHLHSLPLEEETDLLLGEQLSYESDLYTYLVAFIGDHNFLTRHLSEADKEILEMLGENELDTLSLCRKVEDNSLHHNGHIHLYRIIQSAFYPSYVKGIHFNALGWIDFTKLWYKVKR